jgi:hypothetical protein
MEKGHPDDQLAAPDQANASGTSTSNASLRTLRSSEPYWKARGSLTLVCAVTLADVSTITRNPKMSA